MKMANALQAVLSAGSFDQLKRQRHETSASAGQFAPEFWTVYLDRGPVLVALAGPNGGGKTTFYKAHLKSSALRFLNADVLAHELSIDSYEAARLITTLRLDLIHQKESFIFQTVFFDRIGDKLTFLKQVGWRIFRNAVDLSSTNCCR
jgi:hypothetical protein